MALARRVVRLLSLVAALSAMAWGMAHAEGLRVAPTSLDIPAPGATETLTLRNGGDAPIVVQARVFRWVQEGGSERYVPTREVVVSPPMTQLAPGATQTVRIIRTAKTRVNDEEAYRVFIDEIPDRSRLRPGQVAFATRLRIPVFFTARGATRADVRWSIRRQGGAAVLTARNAGQSRLKLADLRLLRNGRTVYRQDGLFGYVLGGSEMRWVLKQGVGGGRLELRAETNQGAIRTDVAGR